MEQQEPVPMIDGCGCGDGCGCEIACHLELRPKGAPGMPELASSVRTVTREDAGRLRIDFDPQATDRAQQMVEAERLCCPHYRWEFDRESASLRITAPANVLDVYEAVMRG